jgi:hypothetical protein
VLHRHRIWDLDQSVWKGLDMPECEGKPFHMRNMVALKDLSFPNHIFLNEDWEGMVIVSRNRGNEIVRISPELMRLGCIDNWS